MTNEEKILVEIGKLNTKFDEIVKPAVSQTYKTKDDMIRVMAFQKIIKYVGGTTVFITSAIVVKTVYSYISKHPPPNIHP